MAAYGFKGLGWFVCGVVVAPACYLVTSQVASERARVHSVERAIEQAKSDIRDLDTEFKTRANFAQLERWNSDVLALSAPRADQYMAAGPAGVAQLDRDLFGRPQVQYASYVVPDIAPAGTTGRDNAASVSSSATASTASTASDEPAMAEAGQDGQAPVRTADAVGDSGMSKPEKVAMLDRKLLSDSTLGDLARRASIESAVPH